MFARRSVDRRHDERIATECLVQIQPLDAPAESGPDLRPCVTHDLSAHGMGVWVDVPYPGWSHLLMSIEQIEGNATRITSLTGSVVRTHPEQTGGRCLLGIRFAEGQVLELTKPTGLIRFSLVSG